MAGSTAIDPALVARFAEALARLNPSGGTIGLAVSGGPDSMAMLLLAAEAIPGAFEVATVDHGLRREASDECALVVAACEARGVACEVLGVAVSEGNVQAEARRARYDALGGWARRRALASVATAHHADDQAETLLMRLNRASGIDGLAGIRDRLEMADEEVSLRVIRPLLGFRRAELLGVVEAAGLPFATDPSNSDQAFDRVRLRKALAEANWLDAGAIAASAGHLADALDALYHAFEPRFAQNMRSREQDGEVEIRLSLPPDTPRFFRFAAVDRALREVGGDPRGGDVERLLDKLERGEGGNVAGVLATVDDGEWYFRREPPRRAG